MLGYCSLENNLAKIIIMGNYYYIWDGYYEYYAHSVPQTQK